MTSTGSLPRVIQTVPTVRADYGGPSRSVPFLCEGLARHGASVRLVTTVPGKNDAAESVIPNALVDTHTANERGGLGTAVGFYRVLQAQIESKRPQLIHDHGLWLPQNALSAVAAWRAGIPLVVTPRGMLEPWALRHRRLKKRIAWWSYQRWLIQRATLLHATAETEAESFRRLGLDQPIAVIPNGVELPSDDKIRDSGGSGRRQALFLSRLHPKKGLPMLLEAWADVQPEEWELVLVGPSEEGHREELEAMARRRDLSEVVTFVGPVDDKEKWSYYADADLFVLPTYSENFGIVVAEALAAEVPVVTTTGAPWEELSTHECGWWVEPEPRALTEALRRATGCDDETRRTMGKRGRQLVEERYSWEGVASQMVAAYRWLVDGGPRPDCVRLG